MSHKVLMSLFSLIMFTACSSDPVPGKKSVAETIPITIANLRGHESLYNEGWFVVSSSKKALAFAKKHGVDNAEKALHQALNSISDDSKDYTKDLAANLNQGYKTTKKIFSKGSENTATILATTQALVDLEVDYAKETFSKAWSAFIKGNVSLVERTKEDRDALLAMGGNYFKDLKSDFSNLGEIASSLTLLGGTKLSTMWEEAFEDAKKSFMDSYEASGESDNSLGGLFHIMYGYLKAIYHGIAKPTTVTVAKGTYHGGKNIAKLAYLPIGATISVVGRSVESLGLTLYHVSSVGIKIVSPTIEAGFLSALSVLSLGSTGVTYVGGGSLGLINQVGTTALAPVAGTGEATVKTGLDTAKLVTFVGYDLIKGSTKIFINEAASGVVLGYNALTALPTQMLLAASDSVFFLAWDGPRLVIASAKGEIADENINKVPVGTVMDLQKLKKEKAVDVKIVSEDYDLIEKMLQRLPADMKVK